MDVTLPNGVVIQGIPEGTNKWTIAEKAISKGLAKPEDFGQQSSSPTEGMSGFQKARAGYGKAAVDLGRGVGQMVGLVDREDVKRSRERDAPLMATGAGKAGYFGGAVANTLPAAFIPGANTVAGAGAIGAGLGFLQPSASTGETATNTALGGALGSGGVLAGRALAAGYRGGKALVEPFTRGGQERIAARTLQAFAGGSDEAGRAAQSIDDALKGPMLEGVQPTTAELAKNPGIAQLERTIKNNPEYLTAMTDRSMSNKDAMMGALDSIAGDPAKMAAAKGARQSATQALYEKSGKELVKPDAELVTLLQRPSMKKAWDVAADLAAENGDALPKSMDEISGKTLHYLKMAMDDLSDNPAVHGIGGNQTRAITGSKNDLVKWIGTNIPDYDVARNTYSSLSKPINQMEIGTAFRNKLQPALADFGASSRTRSAAYAEALRSGDDFAANTLGRSSAKLKDVMAPDQMSKLKLIAEQLGRRTNADELGRAVGSNTGQNLVSQNILRQLLGPLGLPETTIQRAAESTLLQSVMRPAQFVGQLGEQRVMANLAKASLDPKVAKEMLRVGIDPKSIGLLLKNQQFIAPALVSGADAARQ
jgi:hypothetical protein